MAFTMSHLIIGDRIGKALSEHIGRMPQFLLGGIAPDAAHYKENSPADAKKLTHLCVGPEHWDKITNCDAWEDNALLFLHTHFLQAHEDDPHRDFILGYVAHVLSDIVNNRVMWLPFLEQHPDAAEKGYVRQYIQESNAIDTVLALTYARQDAVWACLDRAVSVDLEGLLTADEIEKQRAYALRRRHLEVELPDHASHRFVTYENTMAFIEASIAHILPIAYRFFPS